MSIKIKILAPVVALLLVAMTALLVSSVIQFSNYIDASLDEKIDTAARVANDELEIRKKEAETIAQSIAGDVSIIRAMENGDREQLVEVSRKLMAGSSMDFTTITDTSGIAFARPHSPEKFGDDVTAMPTVSSALKGTPLTAIEPGSTVRMSACCGVPIINENNELLGVVVSGYRLDTEKFVDSIKTLVDCEVTVFLDDERISTTVLNENGDRAIGTKAAENIKDMVLNGEIYKGRANILGQETITCYEPIYGPGGDVYGMLFVGHYTADITAKLRSFVMTGIIITLALLAVSVLIMFIITGRIVSPIREMVSAAHALAAGKTEIDLQIKTKDEMSGLAEAFRGIIENNKKQVGIIKEIADGNLSGIVSERSDDDVMNHALKAMLTLNNEVFAQIVSAANHVSHGAQQISDSSQSLAHGSTEQSASMQELSGAIAEMSDKTRANSDTAGKAATLAGIIKENAEKGSLQMDEMIAAVKEISQASNDIGKVIKVIDDIAFQTNILALNASVEAARAGAHGKGFAVVAEEVRNLAAKSAEAAKNTENLIVGSMEKAEQGARIADETAFSLNRIISGVIESSQLVGEIASSSEEQSSDIVQINQSISQVAQIIHQNSAASEESAAAAAEMNEQAALLKDLVARFKLRESK